MPADKISGIWVKSETQKNLIFIGHPWKATCPGWGQENTVK